MTRKDFQVIAGALRANGADPNTVEDFARRLAESNPRFDRARFIQAARP